MKFSFNNIQIRKLEAYYITYEIVQVHYDAKKESLQTGLTSIASFTIITVISFAIMNFGQVLWCRVELRSLFQLIYWKCLPVPILEN